MAVYQREIAAIEPEKIAYVDETGIDQYICREHGYSPRGVPVSGKISGRKYKRVGIVAAQLSGKIMCAMQYEGIMDSQFFEAWFELMLLPDLPQGTLIVMDNATFHRKKKLLALAEQRGFRVLFLPPYSPDLNPIEHFWSQLKRRLRSFIHYDDSFDDALVRAFQVV